MNATYQAQIAETLVRLEKEGLYKTERHLSTAQGARIATLESGEVVNLCANNYLGLANHPEIVRAAHEGLDRWGFGLSSVRFICGTQELHKELEAGLSAFLGTEDTLLYSSCFDANGGLFETLLDEQDAVISDELNHASLIDGIRLCKARRYRYRNADLGALKSCLAKAREEGARHLFVVTDGVFSMDGTLAPLDGICELAQLYEALVVVDDSHAVGFIGPRGRGTPELFRVQDRVDLVTGTLGKALGGASGGYVSGRRPMIALLRQRSRPYLFSNTLAPAVAAASLRALALVDGEPELRRRLAEQTRWYREALTEAGLWILPGQHPIVPVMVGEARLAQEVAAWMLGQGVYVVGFFYPVVPQGRARIRTQVSAAHSREDLARAVEVFKKAKKHFGLPTAA